MIEYELFYLVGESKEGQKDAIRAAVEGIVTKFGGTFLPPETEEKRKLAYEVKGEARGTYIARRFTLPGKDEQDEERSESPVAAITHELQLAPDVLRFLIVRADDLPELKPIERVVRQKTEKGRERYERRGATQAMPAAPVTPVAEEKPTSQAEIDKQLKEKLDI